MTGKMPTDAKYKAVLSRTVIHNGAIKQLHVVRPTVQDDGSTIFETAPFNLETEATVMVDYPVALLNHADLDGLSSIQNMSCLIETARQLTAVAVKADTAVLLKPGCTEVLDFQTGQYSKSL